MVKVKLCEKVVEVRMVGGRVMAVVLFLIGCVEDDLWVCSAKWQMFWKKCYVFV